MFHVFLKGFYCFFLVFKFRKIRSELGKRHFRIRIGINSDPRTTDFSHVHCTLYKVCMVSKLNARIEQYRYELGECCTGTVPVHCVYCLYRLGPAVWETAQAV